MPRLYRNKVASLLIIGLFAAWLVTACQPSVPSNSSNLKPGSILYQDDFSNSSSGWIQGSDERGSTQYVDNAMRIFVSSDVSSELTLQDSLSFADARIEVDSTKADGPEDNDFGIVCRYQDENNFYFLEISSDGYYGIGKYRNNQLVLIGSEQMQSADAIMQGNTTNHLRADCVGNKLSLYVNGVKLAEVDDPDFLAGKVGLIAGTFKTPGVDIRFDNFSVKVPEK